MSEFVADASYHAILGIHMRFCWFCSHPLSSEKLERGKGEIFSFRTKINRQESKNWKMDSNYISCFDRVIFGEVY